MKLRQHVLGRLERRGHTMVEVAIAAVILAIMFGAVGMTTNNGNKAYQQGMSAAVVDTQAQRLLERLAQEFLDADRSSLIIGGAPPSNAPTISFRRPTGFAAGALTFGALQQIAFRPSLTDANDGIDNDNNGLIDECRIVLIPDFNGAPTVQQTLGTGVREYFAGESANMADDNGNGAIDERGLWATYDPNTHNLTLRLSIERLAPDGNRITRTVQTAVLLRND